MSILILLPIFLIGYFLLVRPQQQQARRQRDLVSTLQLGAEVQTHAGIVGRIVDLDDQFVQLHVGPGTTITFIRGAVQKVISLPDSGASGLGDAEPGDRPYGGEAIDLSDPVPQRGLEPAPGPAPEPDPGADQHPAPGTAPAGSDSAAGPTDGGAATPGPVFQGSEDQAGQPTRSLPVSPPSDPAPPPAWTPRPGPAEGGDGDAPA